MFNFLLWIVVIVLVYGLVIINRLLTQAFIEQNLSGLIYHGVYFIALCILLTGNLNIIFAPVVDVTISEN